MICAFASESCARSSSVEVGTAVVDFRLAAVADSLGLDFSLNSGGGTGEVSSLFFLETAGVSNVVGEV